jgi:phosphoglycerate dehydrogenase-like enzyme
MRIAILDDYQNGALQLADWSKVEDVAQIHVFTEHLGTGENVARALSDFEIVVAMRERTAFPATVIQRFDRLKLIVTTGPRNASIDFKAAEKRNILICGTDSTTHLTAEMTWALTLALFKKVPGEDAALRRGEWQTVLAEGLHGKTLGIIGLGRLGSQVALVGRAFGMELVAWSQNMTKDTAEKNGARLVSKSELLSTSDVVSIHVVLGPRTIDLIGAEELAMMKRSAYLVNTSRGPIVNEAALIDALENKTIAGAGLDVYDVEPLPRKHALRSLPNTVLSPHLGYATTENLANMYSQVIEDILGYIDGNPIRVLSA